MKLKVYWHDPDPNFYPLGWVRLEATKYYSYPNYFLSWNLTNGKMYYDSDRFPVQGFSDCPAVFE